MRFDLEPHIGASNLKFGMTRENIIEILGIPEYSSEKSLMDYGDFSIDLPAKDGFYKNELQVTYDDNNLVDFIEFYGRSAELIEVFIQNINVFKTPVPLLIDKIIAITNSDFDKGNTEIPYSYTFPSLDLAVWRQVIPRQNERTVEIPESDEGKYFWSIGIGKKDYYKSKN